jgi:hypothetical protein
MYDRVGTSGVLMEKSSFWEYRADLQALMMRSGAEWKCEEELSGLGT